MTTASERTGRGLALVAPALLWTAAFFLVPMATMLLVSTWQRVGTRLVTEPSLVNYAKLWNEPALRQALVNSLETSLVVTLVSVLLAYPLAYILAFSVPPRWRRLALLLAILPFWTSYVVRSYAWLLVLSPGGLAGQVLEAVGLARDSVALVNNRTGTVIGFVHFFTMLLTLTIFASLVRIPTGLQRAAANLGASPAQTFFWVTLPLSVPGIVTGAFLTFVLTIGDYITPQILGGGKDLVLPQVIMLQLSRRADLPMASALSLVLMLAVTLAFLATARWLRLERV
ncbi:MAG: ABC transporter permease [Geminicoccaceae bacterium]